VNRRGYGRKRSTAGYAERERDRERSDPAALNTSHLNMGNSQLVGKPGIPPTTTKIFLKINSKFGRC
jgi:hypothetical protein